MIERIPESVEKNDVDGRDIESIPVDIESIQGDMYDLAEQLILGEKENAKVALGRLWSIKKNIIAENSQSTLNILINFFQDKMDILRLKEEHLREITDISHTLIEEKKKREEECATIDQQIEQYTQQVQELNTKIEELHYSKQKLLSDEETLLNELNNNEYEIINGLFEIVTSYQNENGNVPEDIPVENEPENGEINELNEYLETGPDAEELQKFAMEQTIPNDNSPQQEPVEFEVQNTSEENDEDEPFYLNFEGSEDDGENIESNTTLEQQKFAEIVIFPKSVVKTTKGRVIGEYYYDGTSLKEKRHYIFNSAFFAEQLSAGVRILRQHFDQVVFSELLQMIQDAYKRISENERLHFENSTNEILNQKTLWQLWEDTRQRLFDDVERFGKRLQAKIDVLGENYKTILQEQMSRCIEQEL